MSDHICDGECVVCNKSTCEFCGEVSDQGYLYCEGHRHHADMDDFEDDEE